MGFLWEGVREGFRLLAAGDPEVLHPAYVSLLCSVVAVVVAGVVAVPYGAWLGLYRPPTHRAQVFVLRVLLAFPTVVIGLVLWSMLSRHGLFGSMNLVYTKAAIAIGETFLAFPVLATHVQAAAAGLDRGVLDESRTLGGGVVRCLRLGLSEIRPALAVAVLTAFARCISELGIALMVGGGVLLDTRTLPAAVQIDVSKGEFSHAVANGVVLLLLSVVATIVAYYAFGEERT